MTNPIKTFADRLILNGYATDLKPIVYGLTNQTAYEVFVEGDGWQTVNPFGNESYGDAQVYALKRRNILSILLTYLNEDQLLHFRKICKPINEMTGEQLCTSMGLVERTLIGNGIDHVSVIEDLLSSITIDK